jgi:peptidoglycan-associated lipoprotein
MRRVLLLALSVSGALALSGCPAKPKQGECKTSKDCLDQKGFGQICVEGRCQECGEDGDCKAGFVCQSNKCVPKPQCGSDADCPAGQSCQGERCVARAAGSCAGDRDCGPDEKCDSGKCVARAEAAGKVPAECADASAFTVYFGFDQATLGGDSQKSLQKLADCLKRAPAKRVLVQGSADERGTSQYNIALGSRRAEAAKKYLSDLGAAGTFETVSYGNEKPVCTESTEACWAKNRRADFQIDR